jgi:hypothetical protein
VEGFSETGFEVAKGTIADMRPNGRKKLHEVMRVVDHEQGVAEHLVDVKQVMDVGSMVFGASIAGAIGNKRPLVSLEFLVAHI